MTDHAAHLDAQTRAQRRHFLMRRLHSLTGIVPVGLFLAEHLWTNSKAIQGQTCFANAVDDIVHLPFLPAIEIFGIFLPLAFHALYGVKLAFESKVNVGAYGYPRNWLFVLQRVTGILTLIFIIVHLKDFRIAKLFGQMQHGEFYGKLSEYLARSTPRALLYAVGVTASVFHFANGLRTFAFSWGVTVSARSQRIASLATAGLGFALWFLGMNTVLFFATGGQAFVPSSLTRGESGRDMCEESLVPSAPEPKSSSAPPAASTGAPPLRP